MPLGDQRVCELCDTPFKVKPDDPSTVCDDCRARKPVPACEDCGSPMIRNRSSQFCPDCWNKRMLARHETEIQERIIRQGFEINGYSVDENDTCSRPKPRQVSPRKQETTPCGEPAVVNFMIRCPSNPAQIQIALCRECLSKMIRNDLMPYLEY